MREVGLTVTAPVVSRVEEEAGVTLTVVVPRVVDTCGVFPALVGVLTALVHIYSRSTMDSLDWT